MRRELLNKLEVVLRKCLEKLGYSCNIKIKYNNMVQPSYTEYQTYIQFCDYVETDEFWIELHKRAIANSVNEEALFEIIVSNVVEGIKVGCETPCIEDVKFYQVVIHTKKFFNNTEALEEIIDKLNNVEKLIKSRSEDIPQLLDENKKVLKEIIEQYSKKVMIDEDMLILMSVLKNDDLVNSLVNALEEISKVKPVRLDAIHEQQNVFRTINTLIGDFVFFLCKGKTCLVYKLLTIEVKEKYSSLFGILERQKGTNHIYFGEAIKHLFIDLIKQAKESITIISPWVNGYALGQPGGKKLNIQFTDYRDALMEAIQRANIFVYYGYEGSERSGKNKSEKGDDFQRLVNTENALETFKCSLKDEYQNRFERVFAYLHIKGVIIDDSIMMVGSCNLLSMVPGEYHKSNPMMSYTQGELMTTTTDRQAIHDVKAYLESRKKLDLRNKIKT